jgi:ABC-type siderophore export system fused ATPase/permease subunit
MFPLLGSTSYYNYLSGAMIALFVVTLIIIFVYEYEVLRRPKPQN